MYELKTNTAVRIAVGPLVDPGDGKTAETSLTVTGMVVDIIQMDNDGTAVNRTSFSPTASGGNNDMIAVPSSTVGMYDLELTAAQLNFLGNARLAFYDVDGFLVHWIDIQVVSAAYFDWKYGTTIPNVNCTQISGDGTAADNCEAFFDGTGYAGGTTKLGVDIVSISGDSTAADNCEKAYDGTGYTYTNCTMPTTTAITNEVTADVTKISGDATAANNLEAALDGTGGVTITAALTGNITGNLSGSVGSVTGAVGSVTGAVGSVAGNVDGSVASVTAGVTLANDAITAAKFDESTAFPLKSADTGATAVARTGADSDTLETLSDEIAAVKAETATIVADTNELQTDWANGGRLDLLLDSASSVGDPWTTILPGAYGAGTAGKIVGDNLNAPVGTVDTVVDAIKVITDNLPNAGALTDISGAITTIDGIVDSILTDTGTTLDTLIRDIPTNAEMAAAFTEIKGATWDAGTDTLEAIRNKETDIETDTQDLQTQIGVDGAGLTALPWNTNWDAEVQSECTDALNAYDPPTKAELDAGLDALPTAAEIKTAVEAAGSHLALILEDTDTTIPGTINAIQGNVTSILEDTGTTLDALIKDVPTVAEFAARTLLAADYATVSDLGTAQTGDVFALLGAPAGASVSADIAAVKADTAAILVETGTTLPAAINALGTGSGLNINTYTVTETDGVTPISNVAVWVTTDMAGTSVVAQGYTSSLGKIDFMLDPGTYYVWRQKNGWTFVNPRTWEVTE